jgi:uridine kinase
VKAAILQQEYFYLDGKVLENQATASILNPDFTDWNKFEESLKSLAIGNPVTVRDYNFMEQKPGETLTIRPEGMIIVTGMHIMSRHIVRKLSSVSVFLEADSDVRLSRRIYQDTVIRKIPLDKAINNYLNNIKPNFETHIEPTKKFCDMVLPNFGGGYSDKHGEDIGTYCMLVQLLVDSRRNRAKVHACWSSRSYPLCVKTSGRKNEKSRLSRPSKFSDRTPRRPSDFIIAQYYEEAAHQGITL